MESKISKLEDILLGFVERVSNEPSSEKETEILPKMAEILADLLKL